MADPLAGQRTRINEDLSISHLVWSDHGRGCPVKKGDIFSLRTCSVEITKTERRRQGGWFIWLAHFTRWRPVPKPQLLDRKGSYTEDPESAMRAQDDPRASTVTGDPMDNPLNIYQPPEPEAIHRDEVSQLPDAAAARHRFETERAEVSRDRLQRSLIEEVREAHLTAEELAEVRNLIIGMRGGQVAA